MEYSVTSQELTNIADAIRLKTGSTLPITYPDGFVDEIETIESEYFPPPELDHCIVFYSKMQFSINTNTYRTWSGTIEYSTNQNNWNTCIKGTAISAVLDQDINLYVLYFRGINNYDLNTTNLGVELFNCSSKLKDIIYLSGKLKYLIDYTLEDFSIYEQINVSNLFIGFINLDLYNFEVSDLNFNSILNCAYMFCRCTSLTNLPKIESKILGEGMFKGCTFLKTIPDNFLISSELSTFCYKGMFQECISLQSIPDNALPATNLKDYCYYGMFEGCTALQTLSANLLPANTLANSCYAYMFKDCTSLTTIPVGLLHASTLDLYCYYKMFEGCSSLEVIVSIDADYLPNNCCECMFNNCSLIKLSTTQTEEYRNEYKIPFLTTASGSSIATTNMFANTGGTFVGTPQLNTRYYTSNIIV